MTSCEYCIDPVPRQATFPDFPFVFKPDNPDQTHDFRSDHNMKTMTCKQMGGPCDAPFHGNKADEVIKAQDRHLKDMVTRGDETHKSALKSMQDRWKHPISGMGWYRKTKKAFAALPED